MRPPQQRSSQADARDFRGAGGSTTPKSAMMCASTATAGDRQLRAAGWKQQAPRARWQGLLPETTPVEAHACLRMKHRCK